MLRYCFYSILL